MTELAAHIKQQARRLGFELVGVAPAAPADGFEHLQDWLAQGFAGDMDYMQRHGDARRHPESILPNVRSVVMVGINYKKESGVRGQEAGVGGQKASLPHERGEGKVSCYAVGLDYHDVLRQKLKELLAWIQYQNPEIGGRAVVDTAPLLERDFARRAGLGWFGKNTMLLNKNLGSYFFIGALLLDIDLPVDEPFETAHCGTCTRCLDACPTDAFNGPYQLDARRCISYLTIELRGPIAEELRPGMGDWIFGCDVCQDVCPWNRKSPVGVDPLLNENVTGLRLDLIELLSLSETDFRDRFRNTPLWRAGRAGLLRNAAIALGNEGDERGLPILEAARHDSEALIREAATWAIAQIRARSE